MSKRAEELAQSFADVPPEPIVAARLALAASSLTKGEVSEFFCARARVLFERAREDLRSLEAVLVARERELVVAAGAAAVVDAKAEKKP